MPLWTAGYHNTVKVENIIEEVKGYQNKWLKIGKNIGCKQILSIAPQFNPTGPISSRNREQNQYLKPRKLTSKKISTEMGDLVSITLHKDFLRPLLT